MENNERYKKLTLLHSNDMHGDFLAENVDEKLVGGVSMLSGYISKVKAEEENVLYCVAGDMFRGSVIDSEYKGVSTVEIMNMLSPDVVTIGNHETDYGLAHLLFIEKCAKFPIINSNLYIKMNNARLFKPYHIIEIGGMKILFIGILTEDVMNAAKNDGVIGSLVDVNDAAKEVEKICNAFNGIDIDFTVLLTHIGFDKDKELAAKLDPSSGVDVIIGGHSHTYLDEPVVVNGISIVQAGVGTDQIGRFDIIVDTLNNCIASSKWETISINKETCPFDPKMEKLISDLKNETDMKYGKVLRRLKCELNHESRHKQTELGAFINDCLKRCLHFDLMFLGSGSIRANKLGPIITLQDALEAFPYSNRVYELKITGAQLLRIFKHIYRKEMFEAGSNLEFFQISEGWELEYDFKKNDFVKFNFSGHPVDLTAIFRVCVVEYDFNNFEKFFGIDRKEIEQQAKPRVVSSSSNELLFEFLECSEPLGAYPDTTRQIFINM